MAARTCCRVFRRLAVTQLSKTSNSVVVQVQKLQRASYLTCNHTAASRLWSQHRRLYGDAPVLTVEKLQQMSLEVVKLFDKADPAKVTLEAHFMNDLGLDSLDVVELVMAFEDEFGCEISDEEAEKIFCVKDAVELLKVKLHVDH